MHERSGLAPLSPSHPAAPALAPEDSWYPGKYLYLGGKALAGGAAQLGASVSKTPMVHTTPHLGRAERPYRLPAGRSG